ncbi:hypothetical protein AMJ85_07095 [candidate division BRC1 bacterium SM23_51]|nr:MAG: hypothetical protein AMJ85_07095 [candidate division BRC1 bacterium SM23_51]
MHPVLFRIGSFDIACYGPLIAIGVLVGVFIAIRRAKTVGIAPDLILDMTFYSVILGFVGSRLFFILNDLRGFAANPWAYIFSRQGFVFAGGLVFAGAFAIWYLKRRQCDIWQFGDAATPSIPLAHMFGRLGCFFQGCCFGRVCPPGWERWGVSFPIVTDPATGQITFGFAYIDHLSRGWIGPEATHSLPVLPVQLYEAGANLLIFLGLIWLWRRRSFRGQIFVGYLAAYSVVRFLLEFLRGDYSDPGLFGLLERGQLQQLMCLVAIGAALVIWLRRRRTPLELQAAPTQTAPPLPENRQRPQNAPKPKRRRRRR